MPAEVLYDLELHIKNHVISGLSGSSAPLLPEAANFRPAGSSMRISGTELP